MTYLTEKIKEMMCENQGGEMKYRGARDCVTKGV